MLQVPIIAPIKAKKAELLEQQPLKTNYNNEFLSGMMTNPDLIRNVAVVGHLHHGKTLVRHSYLCLTAHLTHLFILRAFKARRQSCRTESGTLFRHCSC